MEHAQAAVMALNAGNDMISGPMGHTMIQMLNAIKKALQDGTLSKARVDEAATRIIALKMDDNSCQPSLHKTKLSID